MGELPAALRQRLQDEFGVSAYDADVITNQGRAVAEYYETAAKGCGDGKLASNWITQTILRTLNDQETTIEAFAISADRLTGLLKAIKGGDVDNNRGRDVFQLMLESGKTAAEAMQELGIEKVDDSELETLCRELIEANPHVVADIKAGKMKAAGALIGQAKKKNPNVDPGQVRKLCIEIAQGM